MTTTKSSKALNIGLWVAQVFLAGMFLFAGWPKLTTPIHELATFIPFAAESPLLVRFIGLSEVLGALGLILPGLLRIKPVLTGWAAIGLLTIMILAVFFHLSRGEFSGLTFPIVLALLSAFVAWGRFAKAPFYTKNIRTANLE